MFQSEFDFKVKFCDEYFKSVSKKVVCEYDYNRTDVIIFEDKDKAHPLLYIEAKRFLENENARKRVLAQVILTNLKQSLPLHTLAIIYKENGSDVLESIEILDDSVLFNNDLRRDETPSNPSKDAIDKINDRLSISTNAIIKKYIDDEISEFFREFLENKNTQIQITLKNCITIYQAWRNTMRFKEVITDNKEVIYLFLVDMLQKDGKTENYGEDLVILDTVIKKDKPLIHKGVNLNAYEFFVNKEQEILIVYKGERKDKNYYITNKQDYDNFWLKYKRPPLESDFKEILEQSHQFYTQAYRKATGGEYTPYCFVEKQNEILDNYFKDTDTKLSDYIIFDPCAGVGNLQNEFNGLKNQCYLSTLEIKDCDVCKIKGFENVVQFDYLKDSVQPLFKHRGVDRSIAEICKLESKKLMIIMNPPYQNVKDKKHNLAIEFFNKVLKLEPSVIVFYYKLRSFFCDEINHYINSGYKIYSHIFSTAQIFNLSNWGISQIIFSKDKGDKISKNGFSAKRYELQKNKKFEFIKTYHYDLRRPSLLKEMGKTIKKKYQGMILGQYFYFNDVIIISNGGKEKSNKITTENLSICLALKGLMFNTHAKYFEFNSWALKGKIKDIPQELFNDAICFSLFYKGNLFSNKTIERVDSVSKNYIMPFSAKELGCSVNDLNVLYPQYANIIYPKEVYKKNSQGKLDEKDKMHEEAYIKSLAPFDFREFLAQFSFSKEAKNLFGAALEIFRFYHLSNDYQNKDFNDSFYDITNAIMGKNPDNFQDFKTDYDKRIAKIKTTKGTKGFDRNTIKYAVNSTHLDIFNHFFDTRDVLAKKINKQLLDSNLLLWERENIY